MTDLKSKRIVVTGGAGFLGSFILAALKARGCTDVFVPRVEDYDLVEHENVKRMYADFRPDLVIHLAADHDRVDRPVFVLPDPESHTLLLECTVDPLRSRSRRRRSA